MKIWFSTCFTNGQPTARSNFHKFVGDAFDIKQKGDKNIIKILFLSVSVNRRNEVYLTSDTNKYYTEILFHHCVFRTSSCIQSMLNYVQYNSLASIYMYI